MEYLGVSWYDLNIIYILIFKSFSLTDTDDTSLLGKKDDGLQFRPDVKGTESQFPKFWPAVEIWFLTVLSSSISIIMAFPALLCSSIHYAVEF